MLAEDLLGASRIRRRVGKQLDSSYDQIGQRRGERPLVDGRAVGLRRRELFAAGRSEGERGQQRAWQEDMPSHGAQDAGGLAEPPRLAGQGADPIFPVVRRIFPTFAALLLLMLPAAPSPV